jgi:type IV pilus assembly protein PilO
MLGLSADPASHKKVLTAILPLLVAGVYYYGWHGRTVTQLAQLTMRMEELQARNDAARPRANPQSIKATKLKLAIYEQHARRLEQLIPLREQVSELLYNVTERAQEAGVDHALIKPESERPGEFYTQQTYAMRVVGTYHAIGRFLAQIGSLPRIVTPTQLTLTRAPDGLKYREPGLPLRLQADFRIQTYVIPTPDRGNTTTSTGTESNEHTDAG